MRISFLGGGNMAEAIIGGLINGRVAEPRRIQVVDPNPDRQTLFHQRYRVTVVGVVDDPFFETDLIVVAVKPQVAEAALAPLAGRVDRVPLLSIMAGVPIARIQSIVGPSEVVRAMPNTPALIGAGITALFSPEGVAAAVRTLAEKTMQAVGETLWVGDETAIDAVTAVSGSGPAYLFLFLEALARAGEQLGLPAETARRLAVATALGAAKLANAGPEPFEVLRARVTSPGGTTAAALEVLLAAGWPHQLEEAVAAAYRRARELAAGG